MTTDKRTLSDPIKPGSFIFPDNGLKELKESYKKFLEAFEQTKASADEVINALTKIENGMANEAFTCDTCGTPHDEEGYGFQDDGEPCVENPDNK